MKGQEDEWEEGRGGGGGLYDVCEWCCINPKRQHREPLRWWEGKKLEMMERGHAGSERLHIHTHSHNHIGTDGIRRARVCVCVYCHASLTYSFQIKVNVYWTWCFALCGQEYRKAKANTDTTSFPCLRGCFVHLHHILRLMLRLKTLFIECKCNKI